MRNFGSPLSALGAGGAALAARCPTPFAFPFTPLGLNLFDIDPSRILSMLHHQTWLAEEALRSRGLLSVPKDMPHRFNPFTDLLSKDYQPNHLHTATAELLSGAVVAAATATATKTTTTSSSQQQQQNQQQQQQRSTSQPQSHQQQYKPPAPAPQQQQQQQQSQQQQHFNLRYPSPAAFFHHHQHHHHHQSHHHLHHHQQQQQPQQHKSARPSTASPLQTATSTQASREILLDELKRKPERDAEVELLDSDGAPIQDDSTSGGRESLAERATATVSSLLYKDSLEQLLQRRHSSSSLTVSADSMRAYSQLLISNTPSCTDTSSCKEKSSSSSTSSTPPPTSTLLAQHQHLSQMLKSPPTSETSLFGGEPIEEETRCVVCNAHFPNVWLLEQHAALQHPHIGPGEEKPFICEQCGQSYRYRSAYAKHKEQNHRARLPADKLFTCDVCGMQFRYLKSFKKHRLNHALERLHGKKGTSGAGNHLAALHLEQDVVTSTQEASVAADEGGEDLRINIKRERERDDEMIREEDQDNTIDSAGLMLSYSDNNSSASASTSSAVEPNVTSSDVIHSTNKRPRLLTSTPLMETDPSYHHHHHHHLQQQQPQHHHHSPTQQQQPTLPPPSHLHATVTAPPPPSQPPASSSGPNCSTASTSLNSLSSLNSINSLNSITSLINAERIPSEQFLGLNPQEASILNFLRVDAAERQRDKRPQASRFACPFCGKCVRSKENLKLHVRKHTGERPFVCLFCGRAFGGKSDLTRHLRIHTGERPYHCESCGKCFARADYLSKHLTTHIHNAPR